MSQPFTVFYNTVKFWLENTLYFRKSQTTNIHMQIRNKYSPIWESSTAPGKFSTFQGFVLSLLFSNLKILFSCPIPFSSFLQNSCKQIRMLHQQLPKAIWPPPMLSLIMQTCTHLSYLTLSLARSRSSFDCVHIIWFYSCQQTIINTPKPGAVACSCKARTWKAEAKELLRVPGHTGYRVRRHLKKKNRKICLSHTSQTSIYMNDSVFRE